MTPMGWSRDGGSMLRAIIDLCRRQPCQENTTRQKNVAIKPARGRRLASGNTSGNRSTFNSSLLALESRIMFDGAAVAMFGAVTTEQVAQSQAEAFFWGDDATTTDSIPPAPTGEPQFVSSDQVLLYGLAGDDTSAARQEILFLTPSIHEYQQLLDDISPDVEVILLDPARDGIEQMAEALAGRTGIDAIHIVSHGTQAELTLGTAHLTLESMNGSYADELAVIGQSLGEKADLLIYGCDFGQGEQGAEAAMRLAQLTGADVAASTDDTGHVTLGGDWELEYQTGQIETGIAVSSTFQEQWVGLLPTYAEFTNYTAALEIKSDANHGQTFTHTSGTGSYTVNQISLALHKESGATAQTITIQLRDSWNGTIRGTATISSSSLTTSTAWYDLTFASVNLNDGQSYTIRVSSDTTSGKVHVGFNSSGGYSGGNRIDTNGSPLTGEDVAFKVGYVAPPNTAPTITNLSGDSLAYSEGAGAVVIEQGANALVADVDSADFNTGTLTVSFTAGSDSAEDVLTIRNQGTGGGQIGVSGSTVTYQGVTIGTFTGGSSGTNLVITFNGSATPTAVTALVKNITYQDTDTAAPTTGARTVRYVLTDGEGGTSANYDTTVTVSDVNDAPMNTVPGAQSTEEDTALVFSSGNGNQLSINDVDAGGDTVVITLTAVNGTLTLSGTTGLTFIFGDGTADAVIAFTGTVADINTALNGLSFTPTANFTGSASVQLTTSDEGHSGSGGVQSDSDTVTVTVNAVNDPPANNLPGPQGTQLNTDLIFSLGTGNQVSISDVDAGGGALQVTLTATNGTVTLSGTTGLAFTSGDGTADSTMTFTGTMADINQALNGLGFTPDFNYSGPASVQLTTDDQGNLGSGGAQSDTDMVSITVGSNNAPVVTPSGGSLSYTENDGAVLIDTGLSVTDADHPNLVTARVGITGNYVNGEDLLSFTNQLGIIGSWNAATGELTLTGSATVADYQTALRSITYTNLSVASNTASRTVSFVANDGVADGAAVTRTITIAAVNDPPVNIVPGTQTIAEDGILIFSSSNGNRISLSDMDAGTGPIQVTLTATNGTLTLLNGTIGLSFLTGDGAADSTMTFTGTVPDIDVALSDLSFTPTANFTGSASVQVTTDDQGNTGGGAQSDVDTVAITVAPVNDAPVGLPAITGTVTEDQTLTADTSGISDADGLGAFSYQWLRNGVAMGGATANTYILGDADVGALMTVRVTYTDTQGTAEGPLTSAPTAAVANVNDAPSITSNGSGATSSFDIQESIASVTTVTSTDPDGGVPAYSIVGGADAARFTINGGSGVLQFTVAPDFEAPTDVGADNVYVVTIQVDDGNGGSDQQTITITIVDAAENVPQPPTPPSLLPQNLVPPAGDPPGAGSPVSRPIIVTGPTIESLLNQSAPIVAAWFDNGSSGAVPSPFEAAAPAQEGDKTAGVSLPLMREMKGLLDAVPPLIQRGSEQVERAFYHQALAETTARISASFRNTLNSLEEDLQQAMGSSESQRQLIVRVAAVGGITLTAGLITWLLQSGSLLASLASTLPAWRHFDPLPVVFDGDQARREQNAAAVQQEDRQFHGLGTLLDGEDGGQTREASLHEAIESADLDQP
jgi:Domain of unknown function (DUF4347)